MERFQIFIGLFLIFGGCSLDQNDPKADLLFFIDTKLNVDSVLFANSTYDREFQFLSFSDTLRIDLRDSINDMYMINFFINGDKVTQQFWLDGESVAIKGQLNEGFEIDTVIGSSLYYKQQDFRKKLKTMLESGAPKSQINGFLLTEFKENIKSPFSMEISQQYYFLNRSDKQALTELYVLQETQSDDIKKDLINSYSRVKKILN